MYRFSVVVAAIVYLMGCQQEIPQPVEAMQVTGADMVIESYRTAIVECDIESLESLFQADADIFAANSSGLRSTGEFMELISEGCEEGLELELDFQDIKLRPVNNTALATFLVDYKGTLDTGESMSLKGRFTMLLIPENGTWLLSHIHASQLTQ